MPSLHVTTMLLLLAVMLTMLGCHPNGTTNGAAVSQSSTATTQPSRPVNSLSTGWELVPHATYSASQTPTKVILRATGDSPTAGYEVKLFQSPLRIWPPQWMLARKRRDGMAAQVITPFDLTTSFNSGPDSVKTVIVTDAAGRHEIKVDQARDG